MQNSIVSGIVSISIGDNRGAGGKNDSSYGFSAPLAHGTVEIGGETPIPGGGRGGLTPPNGSPRPPPPPRGGPSRPLPGPTPPSPRGVRRGGAGGGGGGG